MFTSIPDCLKRTRINKTVQVLLEEYGAYGDLSAENDIIDNGLFAHLD